MRKISISRGVVFPYVPKRSPVLLHGCCTTVAAPTLLLAKGVHPEYVQTALGHASIRFTLDTYSHWMPSMAATPRRPSTTPSKPNTMRRHRGLWSWVRAATREESPLQLRLPT